MKELTLYFDGSCWPNPGGTAAYGYTVSNGNTVLKQGDGVIEIGPNMSNNYAEFHALYQGLRGCASLILAGEPAHIKVYGDSDLVIKMITGRWRASSYKLYYPAFKKADDFVKLLKLHNVTLEFQWIPREQNTEADKLSKNHENNS